MPKKTQSRPLRGLAEGRTKPQKAVQPVETLTEAECCLLLAALQDAECPKSGLKHQHRNYTMALIMLDVGLRVGELVKLRTNQLWFAEEPVCALCIETGQAKNNRQRTIPLTGRVRKALEVMNKIWWALDDTDPTAFAFYNLYPLGHLTTRQVQRIISNAAKRSIGRPIHPHVLRHTFATRLMRKCSTRVVQQLLGHASLQSTQVYTHPNHQDLQNAIDSLNEV